MNKHNEPLEHLQRAMKIKEQVWLDLNTDEYFAITLYQIGRCLLDINIGHVEHEYCLLEMNKQNEALEYLQRAMKIDEQMLLDLNTDLFWG